MNISNPEGGSEKEALFATWITEMDFGSFSNGMKFWVKYDSMPNGSGGVYREWRDQIGNMRESEPRTLELATQFEELTGYTAEEFKAYVDGLNA